MKMKELKYKVTFLTPAFLGNADQSAQWRTPPFKALLRQWWRVAYAADKQFNVDVAAMRREEGLLFGNAWLENNFRNSFVRIRLDHWTMGTMKQWQPLAKVSHPEVKIPVGSDLYLGYGPLVLPRGAKQPQIKSNAAIQAGESAIFSLALPADHIDPDLTKLLQTNGPRVERALWLMHRYGTLGGRSRNGWGGIELTPVDAESGRVIEGHTPPTNDLDHSLQIDWPHAIGQDNSGALIWQTEAFDDWKVLMKRLSEIKIGMRTQFKFSGGRNVESPEARHWLSYPVTNHSVRAWGNNDRLPNSIRYKARIIENGKLTGVIFHVPHLPPRKFRPDRNTIKEIWRTVHQYLDAPAQGLTRIKE